MNTPSGHQAVDRQPTGQAHTLCPLQLLEPGGDCQVRASDGIHTVLTVHASGGPKIQRRGLDTLALPMHLCALEMQCQCS